MHSRALDLPVRRVAATLVVCIAALMASAARADVSLVDVVAAERAGTCDRIRASEIGTASLDGRLAAAHLARCLLDDGAFDGAVAAWARVPQPASLPVPWAAEIDARIALLDGRHDEAAAAFAALASDRAGATSLGVRARHIYYLGLAQRAAGDTDAASVTWRRLLREFPASEYASRVALELLDDRPSARARLDMALAALRGRHYAAAEQLLLLTACHGGRTCSPREAVRSGDDTRYEAAFQLGFMLFRYRREFVDRSLVWLSTVAEGGGPRRVDALYYYALAVQRMERHEEARRAWRVFVDAAPGDARVDEADYMLGWLYHDEDRHEDAVDGLRRYLRLHPAGARVDSARRALAWSLYRTERHDEAIAEWVRTEAIGGPWWRGQAWYWRAVSLDALGDLAGAEALWRDVIETWPLTWYALLAARRLGEPLLGDVSGLPGAEAAEVAIPSRYDAAIRIADLGLISEARALVDAVAGSAPDGYAGDMLAMRTAADPDDWRTWLWRYDDVSGAVPTDVEAMRARRRLSPPFHSGPVLTWAPAHQLPPSLVWAIMQKESTFDPFALSESDAMGLMQVIPQTALSIAERMGEHYVDGMLFEPWHAIRYGSWYLGALKQSFNGQIPLAIGAYNAGPVAMESWVQRNAGMPLDEFVEEIAYAQARDYIKRVTTIMIGYELAVGDRARLSSPTLGGILPLVVDGTMHHTVTF